MSTRIVTFDAGQTLVELDLDFLARRAALRGVVVEPAALHIAEPAAWQRYDALVDAGELDHPALWRDLMAHLLATAGATGDVAGAAAWLYDQQPQMNLFRKPVAGMVELARELATHGVRVAVLSNSEGGLAELLAEVGIADAFELVVDSTRVGLAKPDPRIFRHVVDSLGAGDGDYVHVGDSWAADIEGALGAGWDAIWFGRRAHDVADPRVRAAHDAAGVRAALGQRRRV
jgi:HAD superfamily hydrolase (TIGR01549 family)